MLLLHIHWKKNLRKVNKIRINYDKEVDAAYIEFIQKKPEGAVEIEEGVILHITKDKKLVSIEILDASKKIPLKNLFNFEIKNVVPSFVR